MNSIPGQDLAPDFNDPLGLLLACHQRMLGFCELLQKVKQHLHLQGLDNEAQQSIRKIHHYFSTAARFHHDDEEQDLFPLLVSQSLKIATIVHELKQDHININQAWDRLGPVLEKPAAIEETPEFDQWVDEFCNAYQQHISKEEQNFFPIAGHLLSTEQLKLLATKMKKRRGLA